MSFADEETGSVTSLTGSTHNMWSSESLTNSIGSSSRRGTMTPSGSKENINKENINKENKQFNKENIINPYSKKVPMILVGNKSDLLEQRVINKENALQFSNKLKCDYIETSAKLGTNIELIFKNLTKQILIKRGALDSNGKRLHKKRKVCIIL